MQMVLYMHSVVDQFGGQKILAEDSTAGQQSHQLTMSFGGGEDCKRPLDDETPCGGAQFNTQEQFRAFH